MILFSSLLLMSAAAIGNTTLSVIEAALAAGVGAMIAKDKPATQAGTMTALAFLVLALAGVMAADYIIRGQDAKKNPVVIGLLLIFGLGSFFTYFGIRKAKNAKAKGISGSLAGFVFMVGSIAAGWASTKSPQTIIISNMYVLLGGIIGYSGQQSTKDKAAMGNQVLAGTALLLLLVFDGIGAINAAPKPANAQTPPTKPPPPPATGGGELETGHSLPGEGGNGGPPASQNLLPA
jgi:hypothetical protein